MAQLETFYNQDIHQPVKVHYLDGNVFSQDNYGNIIGVNVTDNGVPASLSGSVSANVIRSDGATVAVEGILSGNRAYVSLPASAYAVTGVISIIIKLTTNGVITTLCAVVANVYQSSTDTVVDPGTIIPSVQDLIDAIDQAVSSIPADYSDLSNAWTYHVPNPRNYIDPGYFAFNKTWSEEVGVSSPFTFFDETGSACCRIMIPVRQGDTLYVGQGAWDSQHSSQSLFATFFWDTNLKFIKRVNYTNVLTVENNGFASILLFAVADRYDIIRRKYYANVNTFYGYDDHAIANSMLDQTDGYSPVEMTIQAGYYTNGVFYPNDDYQAVMLPVTPGDKFKVTNYLLGASQWPCAFFYDSQMRVIGNTGIKTVNYHYINYDIEIPANCAYLNVHNYAYGPSTGPALYGLQILKKSYGVVSKPLAGKQVVVFGDSITYVPGRWRNAFFRITGATQCVALSYPGAHLTNYPTTVLDGNFNTGDDDNIHNVVCNQVYYYLQHKDTDYADFNPDIFIIAAGTNDGGNADAYAESTDINVYNNVSGWLDVDTIDLTTFDGAMRWIHTKLLDAYPNAKIVFCSPIQMAVQFHENIINITVAKEKKMERVAGKLADRLVKAGTESGITGEHEHAYQPGLYFTDGIHPNTFGGNVLGTYYANTISRMFTSGDVN